MKLRIITLRPSASWYNESINEAKRKRRRLEHRWRKSRLCIDRQLYAEQCKAVNDMLKQAKVSYYSSIISENKSNQSILFNTVDKLLHRKPEKRYPTALSTLELSNTFADFFQKKIIAIRNELSTKVPSVVQQHPEKQVAPVELTEFKVMTESEVDRLINMSSLKSCELDPIPTSVLKGCKESLLPVFTNIVNLSLQTAHMPSHFKNTMVRPKIKKASLDYEKYPSFRPISNLKFISKVTEKAVPHQLNEKVSNNDLGEYLQSAYKCFHSTEIALLKVQNDILRAIDEQKCIVLLLLDMSAAFDTVDHDLHCTALHCTALHCTALHCTVLCTALCTVYCVLCTVLHCTVYCVLRTVYCVLHCTVLYVLCTVLYCTVLCTALCTVYCVLCTVLYCTVLYCTALHCTVLCTVLYCTVLYFVCFINIVLLRQM